jgi:hypothetical protein
VWEGSRSCFHFISYSSRTMSHRHKNSQKQHSRPAPPNCSSSKARAQGVHMKGTPLTSVNRQSLPQERPAQRNEQEARTAMSCFVTLGK